MKTWTDEEVDTLLRNYNNVSNEELSALIPNKTYLAIYKKAYMMGLRKTEENKHLNRSIAHSGSNNHLWKGGVSISTKGYRMIKMPEHHRADSKGYVLEHILIFEKESGIRVPDNCCIHHLNGDKSDNRIENLCMMTHSAHTVFHHLGAKRTKKPRKEYKEGYKE